MTDNIVKELRAYTCDYFSGNTKHLTWEAADRIEELEKAVVDLVQHISRADLAYSVKTETRLIFRALMDKKND